MSLIRLMLLAALTSLALLPTHSAQAIDFIVDDAGNDPDNDPPFPMDDALCMTAGGTCTLRAAIEEANERTGPHKITFDPSITAIALVNDIPDIQVEIEFDGTNASAVGERVDINGDDGIGGNVDCFTLASTGTVDPDDPMDPNDYDINNPDGAQGSTIKNFVIRNCSGDGIDATGHGYTFQGNLIGVTPTGDAAAENARHGINLSGVAPPPNSLPSLPDLTNLLDNPPTDFATIAAYATLLEGLLTTVADPSFITTNVISGNNQSAIVLGNPMTLNNFVSLNVIGLSNNSLTAIPNGTGGGSPPAISIQAGAYANFIGPGNVISGNTNTGIHITGEVVLPNFVMGNVIGPAGLPGLELGNGEYGVDADATLEDDDIGLDNETGYTLFLGPANIISDNKSTTGGALDQYGGDASGGVLVDGEGVRIFGNAIGLFAFPAGAVFGPADQVLDVGNSGNGIVITGSNNQVGGSEVFEANFILHNERHGILVKGNSTVGNIIQGNFIGVSPPTGLDIFNLGNLGHGIIVHQSSSTTIGGPGDLDDNVIAGNGINGIALRQGAPTEGWSNLIQRNQIYANGVTTPGEGIGIDLEGDCFQVVDAPNCNDPDPFPDIDGDDPNDTYANKGQNRPMICTGAGVPVAGCTAPSFNSGSGATTSSWTIETRPSTTLRIEYFSLRPDGMTFLYDEMVTTDAAGLPTGGSCVAGVCTSSGTPSTATDTRGTSVVMTATDLFPTDVPPVDGLVTNDPANNTSEISEPAGIPQEIAFSSATYTAGEADGTALITLQRLGDPIGAVQVDVVLVAASGSATSGGVDYTFAPPNPIMWADGDGADKTFTISINSDLLDENNETVNIELANPSGAIEGTPNAATLTITDDDNPPTITIANNSVAEGDVTVQLPFTATLSAASGLDVVVTYSTADGSATAPADYTTQTNQTVTIFTGDTDEVINIDVAGDLLDEDDETFLVNITATNTTALGSDLQAIGTITDNDPLPLLSINDVGPLAEGNGPGTTPFGFTLSLNTVSGRPVTASVTSGDALDTALAPGDYASVTNQIVTIPAGMLTAPFTVNVVGDTTFEPLPTETFTLTLAADAVQPLNATLLDPTGIGIITNDDGSPGTLQFTPNPADQSVAENVGSTIFTVSRTGGTAGAVSTTITLGGDAVLGPADDYTTSSLTLNWADGDATSQTVTITVNDDVTQEAAETVTLQLGAPTGGATLGIPSLATLTIVANDAPAGSLQFTPNPADQTVAENVGSTIFTVSRTGGTAGAVSTTITLGGDAVLGPADDYTTSSLTLNWADGDATSQTVTITVNDDVTQEAAETVTLQLGAPTGGATLGIPSLATLTIVANDAPAGSLQFTPNPADQTVAENVGSTIFTVSRTGGTAGAVSTTITLGGDAVLGPADDYTTSSLTLNWADGDATSQTVTITVSDDVTPEAAETVTLQLGAPTGGATLGAPSLATLTISANDAAAGTLQFTPNPADQTVAENVGTATFTVSRTGGTAGAVSTTITLGGDAVLGPADDYTTSSLTLNWADGDATSQTVTITVNDDVAPEAAETVTLQLGAPIGGATLGVPSLATLTISANDAAAGTLQFTPNPADQTVAENVGTATFTVTRTGGTAGAVSTTITLGGNAVLGPADDYTTSSLTLNWADGDATSQTVTITVNDDVAPEAAETVTLQLGAPTGGAVLGVPSLATLTISANDAAAGSLQFTPNPADQTVAENVGTATFTVSRTGGTAGAVSTTITLGGDAVLGAGNDYTTSSLTLSWADGDATSQTVTITVNDDVAPEAAETVTLQLGAPIGGAVLGVPSLATLTISANDAAAGSLQFTPNPADQTVAENVGTATFTVSRTGGTAGAVSTTITLGGTAVIGAGNDYTTSSLTLNWADGDATSQTVTITVNDDVAPEAAETVTLQLGAPTGGAVLGVPSLATLTISANDAAAGSLQFTPNPADQTVAENVGTATFTVTRTGGMAGAVSTTITLGGTAVIGVGNDYTTSSLTLNWADGVATSQTVTITVNDDLTPEAAETVTLTLGAPTGGAVLGVPSAATLTISANDAASGMIQFAAALPNQTVNESAGTATFNVSRTGGSSGAVSVTVTLGGTAANPADYTNTPLVLNWADGDGADKLVTFTIVDDAAPEANETVTLSIGAPTGGATVGATAAATLTIIDNDGFATQATPAVIPATSRWTLAILALLMLGLVALTYSRMPRP